MCSLTNRRASLSMMQNCSFRGRFIRTSSRLGSGSALPSAMVWEAYAAANCGSNTLAFTVQGSIFFHDQTSGAL